MKHWTEPNGILLIQIPIDWQYLSPSVSGYEEQSPYSFRPYEDPIGCFQLSCYPLSELAPTVAKANPDGVTDLNWIETKQDDSDCCIHLFYGAYHDQALIAKYIYSLALKGDQKVSEQLAIVNKILNSTTIVPIADRKLAADLEKFDRFTGSLAASHDLLNSAIEAEACIEIIAIAANQIDAYLRLSLVIAKQLINETNDIEIKYLYQADGEKGIMERKIFDDALKFEIINQLTLENLNELYNLRNRVIHRYIISDIKSRDLLDIAVRYLEAAEETRLTLKIYEQRQADSPFGVYGKKFGKTCATDDSIRRLHASANDKHLLEKYNRKLKSVVNPE